MEWFILGLIVVVLWLVLRLVFWVLGTFFLVLGWICQHLSTSVNLTNPDDPDPGEHMPVGDNVVPFKKVQSASRPYITDEWGVQRRA